MNVHQWTSLEGGSPNNPPPWCQNNFSQGTAKLQQKVDVLHPLSDAKAVTGAFFQNLASMLHRRY